MGLLLDVLGVHAGLGPDQQLFQVVLLADIQSQGYRRRIPRAWTQSGSHRAIGKVRRLDPDLLLIEVLLSANRDRDILSKQVYGLVIILSDLVLLQFRELLARISFLLSPVLKLQQLFVLSRDLFASLHRVHFLFALLDLLQILTNRVDEYLFELQEVALLPLISFFLPFQRFAFKLKPFFPPLNLSSLLCS